MPSPFDKVLTGAGVIGPDGKVTQQEKQKFASNVENILKKGSNLPGLSFPPDPFAEQTAKRLKESASWNKTYAEGLLTPTLKSLDTPGNLPLFPIHDISSTFNVDLDLNELKDPTNFTPPSLVGKSGLTLPEVSDKLLEITTNIPAIPPLPQLPPVPTPDSILENFEIPKSSLSLPTATGPNVSVTSPDLNANVQIVTKQPIDFFGKLLTAPIDVFKELLSTPDETLNSAVDGSLPQLIFQKLIKVVKIVLAALGAAIEAIYVLVSTILAWVYKIVSAIAASVVSAIIGTGSISKSIYNMQLNV